MKYVVLRVDGDACRVIADRAGAWVEHADLDAARAAARGQATRDEMPTRRYCVVAVHAEVRAKYDERGALMIAMRDPSGTPT